MQVPHGMRSTEALIGFVFDVMDLCSRKMVNGHVSLGLWDIMPLIGAASAALHDVALVPEEVKNMTEEDKAELHRFFVGHMAMEAPAVQKAIQAALDTIIMLIDLYGLFRKPAG